MSIFLSNYSVELWLFFGLILILIEFTQIPGIGLIFVGFGAFTTALLINYYPISSYYQIITLGVSSLIWLLILWHPLKYSTKNDDTNINRFSILGSIVQVINKDIKPNEMGQVFWSGTIMNAQLADSTMHARVGETLQVVEIKGNILVCAPQNI